MGKGFLGIFSCLKDVTTIEFPKQDESDWQERPWQCGGTFKNAEPILQPAGRSLLLHLYLVDQPGSVRSFQGLPNLKTFFLTGNSMPNLGFPAPPPKLQYLLLNDKQAVVRQQSQPVSKEH